MQRLGYHARPAPCIDTQDMARNWTPEARAAARKRATKQHKADVITPRYTDPAKASEAGRVSAEARKAQALARWEPHRAAIVAALRNSEGSLRGAHRAFTAATGKKVSLQGFSNALEALGIDRAEFLA